MNKLIFYGIFLITGLANSQSILMTINNDTIYTSTFEKNNKKSLELLGTKQSIDHFIDFNLLKQYALKNKIDRIPEYHAELIKQGEILKDSLYYPTEIIEPLLRDYYTKIKTEKKIQLLLFKTKNFKNKKSKEKFINSIIKKIDNNPIKFEKAVYQYSQISNFAKPVYPDIFSLNKDLVDAIYRSPLKTVSLYKDISDNYYLLLVTEERKYLGEIVLDEIYISDTTLSGKTKIDKIYKELQEGADFKKLKQKYSQNINKTSQLSNFYTNIENDDLYNYTLKQINMNGNVHTVSNPIKLQNGYAIYKYFFRESYDTYSIARKKLYNRLKKSKEIDPLNIILINELKNYPFFKVNNLKLEQFISSLPDFYDKIKNFDLSDEEVLIDVGGIFKLTNKALLNTLKEQLTSENYILKNKIIDKSINEWEKYALLEYYKTHFYELDRIKDSWENLKEQLLIKYSFAYIARQAQSDIEGQKEFLKTHASKFTWNERIQGTFYYCFNTEVEKQVLQMLKNKKSAEDIKNYFKGKAELLLIKQGKLTRESVNIPEKEVLSKGIYVVDSKNRRLIIDINKIIKNDTLTLEELRTTYINEYVDYKTSQTINYLKKEAHITINEKQEKKLSEKYH